MPRRPSFLGEGEAGVVLTENVLFLKSLLRLHFVLRQNAVFVCLIYRKS